MGSRIDSSDELESLSDVELHQKLLQYGLPKIPVTETTRKVIIKRLRNHIKKENYKRKHVDKELKTTYSEYSRKKSQPYYTINNSPPVYQTHTPHLQESPTTYSSYENYNFNPPQQRSSSKMYAPPPILASDSCEDFRKTSFYNMNTERPTAFNNPPPKYNQMQNMQMGMVGRLLSFRDATLRKKPTSIQSTPTLNDAQKVSYRNMKPLREASPTNLTHIWSRFAFPHGTHHSIISQVLVCALIIFFTAIAIIYATMGSENSNVIREKNILSVVCDRTNETTLQRDCVEKDNLGQALLLSKELLKLLQERINHYYCVSKSKPIAVSFSEFIDSWNENAIEGSKHSAAYIIHDIQHLIAQNPQWGIEITDKNGKTIAVSDKRNLAPHETFLMLLKPNIPKFCIFMTKLKRFFTIIGIAALIAIFLGSSYAVFNYIKQKKRLQDEEIERFGSEIISELIDASKREHESDVMMINLRDKILPSNNRSSHLKAWNKALQLIELNESRVLFGLKLQNGKEVRTMKWIGETPEIQSDVTKTKKWQSPAFDNRNQLIRPPTPCLKIRHMFDCSEISSNLSQIIYNAIVEKVGPKCKIIDIQLDKQTCCVYVRCATAEDAGLIHNEINGWWFDKRLVSIKFLHLERYLSRFPESE